MTDPTNPPNDGGTLMTPPAGDPPAGDPPAGDPPAGDPPAGDPPKADDPPKAEGAPETYDFKPPEGREFDPEFLKVYTDTARELDLTQDKAQKMLDKVAPVLQAQQQARIDAVHAEWTTQSKTDKEFGGEKLAENLGIAKQALEKFGTAELKDMLNATGIGNHPEVIRFFYRAGKAITADGFVGGQQEGNKTPKTFNDFANVLYGS